MRVIVLFNSDRNGGNGVWVIAALLALPIVLGLLLRLRDGRTSRVGRMSESSRSQRLAKVFWVAFLLAVLPNTVEAFGAPDGAWWTVLRFVLSTVFIVAALAAGLSRIADRRGPRSGEP